MNSRSGRPLIVGQAPSQTSDPAEPLSGRSGVRLAEFAGLTLPEFLARFERRNLVDEWPGKAGKGDRPPGTEDSARAAEALSPLLRGRLTVLLGDHVARAFRFDPGTRLIWHWRRGGWLAVSPHPSGVSRWLNDPVNADYYRSFWTRLAAGRGP